MIQTIVFDMDGVLIDTEAMFLTIWKRIADRENIPDIEHTLKLCTGITAPETEALFYRVYGKDFPYQKHRTEASQMYQEELARNGLPVKPGVYELFDFLREHSWRIALASSTREAVVREEMESLGLLDYFQVIVCGDMVSHSKPHPEIYLKSCQLLGTSPSECYAVEDSPNGIRSAYRAGMKTIMVPDLILPDEELEKMLFQKFDSLLEVRDFLMQEPPR